MRDIIWTIIVVWLVYKVVDVFKSSAAKHASANTHTYSSSEQSQSSHGPSHSEKDIKEAVKKHLNKEGEYVDFEDVK